MTQAACCHDYRASRGQEKPLEASRASVWGGQTRASSGGAKLAAPPVWLWLNSSAQFLLMKEIMLHPVFSKLSTLFPNFPPRLLFCGWCVRGSRGWGKGSQLMNFFFKPGNLKLQLLKEKTTDLLGKVVHSIRK